MKLDGRNKTILIALICVIVLVIAYLVFFNAPIKRAIEAANTERDDLMLELQMAQTRVDRLDAMRGELDSLGDLDGVSRMGSYNNREAELSELNSILGDAVYTANFANVTRSGDTIRRNVSLSFTTLSYQTAKRILSRLAQSQERCLLGNVSYSYSASSDGRDTISISTTATFFETMYGGVPDEGLPADSGTQTAAAEDTDEDY